MHTMQGSADVERLRAALSCMLSLTVCPDADAWRRGAARTLRDLVGADAAYVAPGSPGVPGTALDLDAGVMRAYEEHFARLDHGIARQRARHIEIWSRRRLWEPQALLRSEYYNDFVLPNRLDDAIGIAAFVASPCVQVSLLRSGGPRRASGTGRATSGNPLRLLRLLLPAFRAGALLSTRWRHWGESLARIVDRLAQPLALCTASGHVVHQNPALVRESILPNGAALLDAVRRAARAVASTRQATPATAPGALRDLSASTPQWRVGVSYIARDVPVGGEPAILVSMEPRHDRPLAHEALAARFGLTRRELQVMELLRQRRSNAEVAHALGVSEHTARHHTEHVLDKLALTSRREVAAWYTRLAEQLN